MPRKLANQGNTAMSFKTPLLFMTAAALGFATAAHASPVGLVSNLVTLTFAGPTVTSIDFNGVLEVTSGQQYSLPLTITHSGSGNDTVWDITLLANRHNNSDIAYDFIQDSGGFPPPYHQWSPIASLVPGYPQQLNFFFGVNVCTANANIGCFALDLGQGNNGLNNNWWIGSVDLDASFDGGYADITLGDGADIHFTPDGAGINTFFVTADLPAPPSIPEPASGAVLAVGLAAAFAIRRSRRGIAKLQ